MDSRMVTPTHWEIKMDSPTPKDLMRETLTHSETKMDFPMRSEINWHSVKDWETRTQTDLKMRLVRVTDSQKQKVTN